MHGIFTSNMDSLKKRIQANNSSCKYNLEDWILDILELKSGMKILDLGCGTGKQMKAIASRQPDLNLTGLDVSQDAINEISSHGFTGLLQSFDEPLCGKYDLIISTYAIYYSKNIHNTINKLKSNLTTSGKVFVVGPGEGTNHEFIEQMGLPWKIDDFVDFKNLEYKNISAHRLKNEVVFRDQSSLLDWWSNHNSYDPTLVKRTLDLKYPFVMRKNVLGVLLYD